MEKELAALQSNTCKGWQENLFAKEGETVRTYLKERGFGKDAALQWRLGLAPKDKKALTKGMKEYRKELIALGLVRKGQFGSYDTFRDRLMFPIWNEHGVIVGFGGRTLSDDGPKYLNTPETEYYKKSEVLYGINYAKKAIADSGEVFINEGYFDVMRMHEHRFINSVAPCGTALTEGQVDLLISLGAHRFVLLYDGDKAGINAARKSAALILEKGANGVVVSLDEGEDPDTYLLNHGPHAFDNKLRSGKLLFTFIIRQAIIEAREKASSEIEIKAMATNTVLPMLKIVSEGERLYHMQRLGEYLNMSVEDINRAYEGLAA